jgi:hypothetical protein
MDSLELPKGPRKRSFTSDLDGRPNKRAETSNGAATLAGTPWSSSSTIPAPTPVVSDQITAERILHNQRDNIPAKIESDKDEGSFEN